MGNIDFRDPNIQIAALVIFVSLVIGEKAVLWLVSRRRFQFDRFTDRGKDAALRIEQADTGNIRIRRHHSLHAVD